VKEMPTIEISKKDFENLYGKKITTQEMEKALMYVKGEIESIEEDTIKIDIKETLRPDLWSTEGIAREIKARTGMEKGIPEYKTQKSQLQIQIEKSVKEVRPCTVAAIIKGIKITEELLIQIIQLQEKIHMTYGRKRKEAAIGIYDYDKIKGNIKYYGANPKEKKFTPLEYKTEMNLEEILETHPKGKEYAHLLKGHKLYPIFEDEKGNVLSMPPIINSNYSGKVTEETKNLFIEVSGFSNETLMPALNTITMALADRGGKIETVTITDSDGKKITTPNFENKKIEIDIQNMKKITGMELEEKEIIELLEKARYKIVKKTEKKIQLEYGNYRNDILHEVDVFEDILIGYDYNKIKPEKPKMAVTGNEKKETKLIDKARDICVGMGLQEILTFTLTSKEKQEKMVELKNEEFVEIANPVSANWEVLRKNLYPELLEFLSKNKSKEYPQKIFEIGKTLELDNTTDTKTKEKNKICIMVSAKEAGFTQAKSMLEAIAREFNKKIQLKETKNPSLKKGKGAEVTGELKGLIGEISEQVLANFNLEMPTIVVEIEI